MNCKNITPECTLPLVDTPLSQRLDPHASTTRTNLGAYGTFAPAWRSTFKFLPPPLLSTCRQFEMTSDFNLALLQVDKLTQKYK